MVEPSAATRQVGVRFPHDPFSLFFYQPIMINFLQQYRVDGRTSTEQRNIKIQFGFDETGGSVDLSQGLTSIRVVSVNDNSKYKCKLQFSVLSSNSIPDRQLYQMKHRIEQLFNEIIVGDIFCTIKIIIMENNGSLFSTIVNGISLWLCYNGINIIDMVTSVSFNTNIDLCSKEENDDFIGVLVFSYHVGKPLYYEGYGLFPKSIFYKQFEYAIQACTTLGILFKEHLIKLQIPQYNEKLSSNFKD